MTENLCFPSPSFLYVFGESHGFALPLSSLHSKVALRSSAENFSVAFEPFTLGFFTLVSGESVSTRSEREAGEASVLPAASVARTAIAWEPSPRSKVVGEAQAPKAPPSTAHSNEAPASD